MPSPIALRRAQLDDRQRLFEWANESATRAASFHPEPISWKDHCRWFGDALARSDRLLLIAEAPDPVGVVRFDLRPPWATMSLTVAPEARGRGFGAATIEAACDWLQQRHPLGIEAWIKPDNGRSIRAFERAGFVCSEQRSCEGQVRLRYVTPPRDGSAHRGSSAS